MTSMTEPTSSREHHLLDGRRVTVADLVESRLLPPGTALAFTRLGETYETTITDAGRIRLADGREFAAPSRAAAECLGRRGGDGWYVWRVTDSGLLLHDLRERLLDIAAESEELSAEAGMAQSDAQRRHQYLRDARDRADAGAPLEVSVRELIALWGAKGRGHRVNQRIEADLDNHGLTTSPGFRKVTIDAPVALIRRSAEETEATISAGPVGDDEELDVGLTVGNIGSALGGVMSVAPTGSLDEAITLMLLNDYSQLAVLSGPHTLRGAVTWKSIAMARHTDPGAGLSDTIVSAAEVRYDQDLIEVLPTLADAEFVFVKDERNAISGIVTTADVAEVYGEMATPFFLIGELDQVLRWMISRTFSVDDVAASCDTDGARGVGSFDELTFGDYKRLLETPANWAKLGWPLDRVAFIKRLDEIREIRNDVMHFNPDPLPSDAESKLRHFLKLLRRFTE